MKKHPSDSRRPDAGPPPDLSCNEPLILRRLLAESLRRLRAGRAVEESHGVVHPEISTIVRDAERLARRLNSLTTATATSTESDELKTLLTDL